MKRRDLEFDAEKDIFCPKIILEDDGLLFEIHRFKKNNMLFTSEYPIKSIEIGSIGVYDLTLTFGNLGHIHLEKPQQVKIFIKALNDYYDSWLKLIYDGKKKKKK
jgi:hypothetical protein